MHELYNYVCDELKDLERKASDKGLSSAELDYANKLTETKKNILKIGMLEDEGYSAEYRDDMMSHARRNTRRDMRGRYSRSSSDIVDQLEDMADSAPDERTRSEIRKLINRMK